VNQHKTRNSAPSHTQKGEIIKFATLTQLLKAAVALLCAAETAPEMLLIWSLQTSCNQEIMNRNVNAVNDKGKQF
jgi:hypothetical protein